MILPFYSISNNLLPQMVDVYACWNFADDQSEQDWYYGNSYEEQYEVWSWYYDYCMDGLWAPAVYVDGAFE